MGKRGIILANGIGIIESDYADNESNDGNIGFMLHNIGNDIYTVNNRLLTYPIGLIAYDEVKMMNLLDMDGRTVKGLGLVVFAGRLWIFNNQIFKIIFR